MNRSIKLTTRSVAAATLIAALVLPTFGQNSQPPTQPPQNPPPAKPATPAQPPKSPGQVFIPADGKGKVTPLAVPDVKTTPAPPVQPLPEALELAEKSFDWGDISDTEAVEHVIKFKNATSSKIKVNSMASCGCTVTTMAKNEFEPGEEGSVTARFDPHGRAGSQVKTITFTVTEPANTYAMQMVNLSANVKALVTFEPPRMFSNDVDHREGKVERMKIVGRKPGFLVTKAEPSSEYVKVKLLEPKIVESGADKVTEVPIEVFIGKDAPIGKFDASITFTTNDERAKPTPYFLGADVVGDVKVTPPTAIARVNTPSTTFTAEMRLDSRSGAPFKITSVEVEARKDMQVVPDIRPGEGGKFYLLSISGVTPAEQGMFTGHIVVSTEGAGAETLRIPFSAAVSRPAAPQTSLGGRTPPTPPAGPNPQH